MSKRKSVRFVEDQAPSDKALLRMSKRGRNENDDQTGDVDAAYSDIGRKLEPRPSEKANVDGSKHTLDSDEEEEEKYDRLNVADVEGQEDATIEFDEETKITPFNMTEEMEEGHFDADGTFIFNKKSEQIRDAWLDNIDWAKIKKDAGSQWQGQANEADDEETSRSSLPVDRGGIYENILQYLQPQETITKALRRLGGSRSTADVRQRRWREKKAANSNMETDVKKEEGEDQKPSTSTPALPLDEKAAAVTKLTELVDQLVSEGEFEIYGFTYEKISHELEKYRKMKSINEEPIVKMEEKVKAPINDDDALDMFADELDETKLQAETAASAKIQDDQKETGEKSAADEVQWEFKWQNEDAAQIYGPHSTQQMQQWTDEGYFKDGVWVRRVGQTDAQFYNSKRIDFDLYT